MFNKTSYRRGVIEGIILYTLGRLGALITPAVFPGWLFIAAPLLFLALQYLIPPLWATRRIQSTIRPSSPARAQPPLARTASRIMKSPTAAGTLNPLATV